LKPLIALGAEDYMDATRPI